jgi:hypothetical protein
MIVVFPKRNGGRGMRDFSKLSIQELAAQYIEARNQVDVDPAELEVLEAEVQRRIGEMFCDFKEGIYALARNVSKIILMLSKAMRNPILIKQYEKEIQRVEQLLKYTKHSQLRRKHKQYLKWLHKRLNDLKEDDSSV